MSKKKTKKGPMPLGPAIFILIAGLFLGSIFTFGMQHWNAEVTRESCALIETQFVSYEESRGIKRPRRVHGIVIDCEGGARYFIDGESVNTELTMALDGLNEQEKITLLIHPNSDTIVELSSENDTILSFDETIDKLGDEATGFLFLGIFMYFCALVGVYYIIFHIVRRRKAKLEKYG